MVMEDITQEKGLRIRFFSQVFIDLFYLRMLKVLFHIVMSVKGLVALVDVMKCL